MTPSQAAQEKRTSPRTARMMMGELMMMAEQWRVDGLPTLIPPRVDQQKLQARLEEMIEQARAEVTPLDRDAIAAQKYDDPGPNTGECCYGNYDDAHSHGYERGWNDALESILLDSEREAAAATPSLDRNLLAEAIFESGVRQTMSQSEQAADNILAEIPIILARLDEGSATPDQGKGEPR